MKPNEIKRVRVTENITKPKIKQQRSFASNIKYFGALQISNGTIRRLKSKSEAFSLPAAMLELDAIALSLSRSL